MSQASEIKNLVKVFLDSDTGRILDLAVVEHLYPNQIARKIGKSNSLVVKRLNILERFGIIEGRFETEGGKAVKKYELVGDKLNLEINIREGGIQLKKEVSLKLISEVIDKCPDLFESKKNYVSWLTGRIKAETVAKRAGLSSTQAEEVVMEVKQSLDYYFLEALAHHLKEWRDEGEIFAGYKKDSLIIPTQRISDKVDGVSAALFKTIAKGEIMGSRLEELFEAPDLWEQVQVLVDKKMVLLEEKIVPTLLYENINKVTKREIMNPEGGQVLHQLGKATGAEVYDDDMGEPVRFLRSILGGIIETKKDGRIIFTVSKCNIHDVKGGRICHFLAGFIEGVMEIEYPGTRVEEIACRAANEGSCTFSVKKRKIGLEDTVTERFKKILG